LPVSSDTMDKKTMIIVIVAAAAVIAAGCACFFLLKGNGGGEPAVPEYQGVWAVEAIHEAYYDGDEAVYEEIPVGTAPDMTITKEDGFYKLVRGDRTYYAVLKMRGLISVSSGDTHIAAGYADGDRLFMSLVSTETLHAQIIDFKRVLLDGEAKVSKASKPSWDPGVGQTYEAYQKTRYVGEVPIDIADSYVLTVDKSENNLIMYRQTTTYSEPGKEPRVFGSVAVPFGKENWLAVSQLDGSLLIDHIMVQKGNLYLFSAADYDGEFCIWDVRYGDKSKNIVSYYDMEGDINYGTEKVLYLDEDGKATSDTRKIMLYGDRSFDDHRLVNLYADENDGPDTYGIAIYEYDGGYLSFGQSAMSYGHEQYYVLTIASYDGDTIDISGIGFRDGGAMLFSQEYARDSQYPYVQDIEVDSDYYKYFAIYNADNLMEWSPMGWGAATYKHTKIVSHNITWDTSAMVIDHDKNTVQLTGNDKAYLYDVTLKFDKVDGIDAKVSTDALEISLEGIKDGFTIGIDFKPVDRLVGDWVLLETLTATWADGKPLVGTSYDTGTLTISKNDEWYAINNGEVEVLGTGDGIKIAAAGLFEDARAAYIIPNMRSEFMRAVYFDGSEAVVKIYAPKGYVGTYSGLQYACTLPEEGDKLPAFKIMEYNPGPIDHLDCKNRFTMVEKTEDGIIFYTVDTEDVGRIYSTGLYMNGDNFLSLCQNNDGTYIEMATFDEDVLYTTMMARGDSWVVDYGDIGDANYPYHFFEGKTYVGEECSAVYKDGKLIEKNEGVGITLKILYQDDEFLTVSTISKNDEQPSIWGTKIGTLSRLNSYSLMNEANQTYKGVYYKGTYFGSFTDDLGELEIIGNLVGEDGSTVVIKQLYALERRLRIPGGPADEAGPQTPYHRFSRLFCVLRAYMPKDIPICGNTGPKIDATAHRPQYGRQRGSGLRRRQGIFRSPARIRSKQRSITMKGTHEKTMAMAAVLVTALLVITCIPFASDSSDASDDGASYGTVKEFSWKDVEEISKALFDKTVEELLMELSENEYGYELYLAEPHFEAEMAAKRDVSTSDGIYSIDDHISGYIEFGTIVSVHGNLPEAGDYQKKDGEDSKDFLDRVLKDHAGETRDVSLQLLFCVYADVGVRTTIDIATGDLIATDVLGKLFVVDYEASDIDFTTEEDEQGELTEISISYEEKETTSNLYVAADVGLKYEDMKVLNAQESWGLSPLITLHINHIYVSSDMANGIWNMVSSAIGMEGMIKGKLPDLILNIIGSGSRVLDIVETIKSLTGTSLKDVDFLADIQASNVTDDDGREYVDLKILNPSGDMELHIPKAGYSVTVDSILATIPSYILSDDLKAAIGIAAGIIGWDTFTADEMDPVTEEKFDEIHEHTVTMIKYDEEYELNIPIAYVILAAIGLIGCAAAVFMSRRGSA